MKRKWLTIGFVLLACLSGISYWVRENHNTSIIQTLNREKLKSESLLAENLSFKKELLKNKKELDLLNERNFSIDQERARLVADKYRQRESIKSTEHRYMRVLRDKQHFERSCDSLQWRIQIMEAQYKKDADNLRDSIAYLQELSQTLSAELGERQNQ